MSTLINPSYGSTKFSVSAGHAVTHAIDGVTMLGQRGKNFFKNLVEPATAAAVPQGKSALMRMRQRQQLHENLYQLAASAELHQPTLAAELRGYANYN